MAVKHWVLILALCGSLVTPCAADNPGRDYWPTSGWRASRPEKQGVDGRKLKAMDRYIRENLPKMTSLFIVRHGYVVFERYYQEDRDSLRSLFSIPKSFISCLVGVSLQEGFLKSIDDKMITYFPESQTRSTDPGVYKITIKHLLTMSDRLSGSGRSFSREAFSRPPLSEPGTEFNYTEVSAQIVSMIITKATGKTALDFGRKYLFEPLGISNVRWLELDGGFTNGADGLTLTTGDAAKLGYLYLNNGMWDDRQIISSGWVAESTRKQIDVPESRGWTNEYGYYWWLRETVGFHAYIAAGWGPQLVYVIPELDLLIVLTTSDHKYPGPPYLTIIDQQIVPAIRN